MNPITFEMLLNHLLGAYVQNNIEDLVHNELSPEAAQEHVGNLFALASKAQSFITIADAMIAEQAANG